MKHLCPVVFVFYRLPSPDPSERFQECVRYSTPGISSSADHPMVPLLLNCRDTQAFLAGIRSVLRVLGTRKEEVMVLMNCVKEVEAAGGRVLSWSDGSNDDRWLAWGTLGAAETAVGPLGPFRSQKDAKRAVALALLERRPTALAAARSAKMFPKPAKVALKPEAAMKKTPSKVFKPFSAVGTREQVMLHLLPGETIDGWLIRHIRRRPKHVSL